MTSFWRYSLLIVTLIKLSTAITWRNCDSSSVLHITEFDLQPMPMDITKPTQLKLVAELTRSINSKMNGTFHIVKKMSGTNLSVRCYPNSQGIDIGSCSNVDICSEFMMMVNASKDHCPQNLIDNGIDCSCPMKLDRTRLNIDVPLVVYPSAVTESWFFGELNIELNVQEQGETLFCLNVDLDVKTFL